MRLITIAKNTSLVCYQSGFKRNSIRLAAAAKELCTKDLLQLWGNTEKSYSTVEHEFLRLSKLVLEKWFTNY